MAIKSFSSLAAFFVVLLILTPSRLNTSPAATAKASAAVASAPGSAKISDPYQQPTSLPTISLSFFSSVSSPFVLCCNHVSGLSCAPPAGRFAAFGECPKSNTTTKLLRRSSSSSIHDSDQLKPPQVVRTSVSDPNATDSSNDEEEKESEFSRFRQRRRRTVKSISEITVVEVSSSSCYGAAGSSREEEVQTSSPSRRPW
ncbi:hypothetical protein LINGRAHAP2_LOCUS9141, partial [Linum grandiflorum]